VLVVILLVAAARRHATPNQASPAVTASVVQTMTGLPVAAYNRAGASGATPPTLIPAADRPSGAPTFLYMGAEYCPYCAAERWVMVATLARFGTLSGLELITSSSTDIFPDTPTFSFAKLAFHGPGLSVQTVELENRAEQPLQTPTAEQNALITKYDAPPFLGPNASSGSGQSSGSIPFILIGGTYLSVGSQFSPGLLAGMTWSQVAAAVRNGTSLGRTILANANVLTGAICRVDGGKPAAVCQSPGAAAGAAALPTTPTPAGGAA
jgi:thiol-disulfide isomerase/thioredoxin